MAKTHLQTKPSYFVVETMLNVRYAETDAMGIVHHSTYVIWMEEGRSAWFRERLGDPRGYALMEEDGYALAVTDIKMRFISTVRYGDAVRIRTWLTGIRSRTITVAYEILNSETGRCLLTAQSVHMCVDDKMKAVTIPDKWTQRLGSGVLITTND
jgi:acyl-CoA thioester hydrolase